MKVIAALSSVALCSASITDMMNEIKAGFNRARMADRNLQDILGPNLQAIDRYGCWCYFQEDHGQGKGSPVDAVDRICKDLHHCYECAEIDVFNANGGECTAYEIGYNSGISFGIDGLVETCDTLNGDLCAKAACQCEGVFVIKMISVFITVGALNPLNLPENGFVQKDSCPINEDGVKTEERDCCGLAPFRYPFKPVDRECCGPATFDPALQECCNDNIPRFSCL